MSRADKIKRQCDRAAMVDAITAFYLRGNPGLGRKKCRALAKAKVDQVCADAKRNGTTAQVRVGDDVIGGECAGCGADRSGPSAEAHTEGCPQIGGAE